jgi:alanine-synthesizing transaminase
VVPGSSFNVPYRNHFRVTLLPEAPVLREVFARIDRVLSRRAAAASTALAAGAPAPAATAAA